MIVALLNQKGGVGKTTLALHLAGQWAREGICARNAHSRAIHPTEKPSGLIEILIRTSCPPGGLVGDRFAGSGAAGEACRFSGRAYLGCEIDPVMARKAADRIASLLPLAHGDRQ